MKIAITSDIYYPMTNGVAVFAHNLALGLAKNGHEVMVICPSMNGKKHRESKDGVTTVYVKSVRFPLYPDQINAVPERRQLFGRKLPQVFYRNGIWAAPYPYPEVKKALDKFKPDVIHNQTAETIAIATLHYARRYKVPLVTTGHAYPDNITGQFEALKPIKKPLDAVLRTYMASFLKNSEYATMPTELAIDDLVPRNRKRFKAPVEALSNGVDLSQFKPGRASLKFYNKYNLPTDRPIVLYLGRVDPEKSIDKVLMAFNLVLEQVPEALMVVAGDGTDRAHLEDLAESMQLGDNIRFLGKVLPPDTMELYRAASLFATASKTETQGIVLIEAAATGLPLVAVDAGAVREVCQDGRNGVLCRPDDVAGLATGMVKILQGDALRVKYGAESLEIAKGHDLRFTVQRFTEIYQAAIEIKNQEPKQ